MIRKIVSHDHSYVELANTGEGMQLAAQKGSLPSGSSVFTKLPPKLQVLALKTQALALYAAGNIATFLSNKLGVQAPASQFIFNVVRSLEKFGDEKIKSAAKVALKAESILHKSRKEQSIDKHAFEAIYDYGDKSEQIRRVSKINHIAKTLLVRPLKAVIFEGASFLKGKFIDEKRVSEAREHLKFIGGQEVTMKTPDGDNINGMYMSAKDFRDHIDKFYDKEVKIQPDGSKEQMLILKPEYTTPQIIIHEQGGVHTTQTKLVPNAEGEKSINIMKRLGLESYPNAPIPNQKEVKGSVIMLGKVPSSNIPSINDANPQESHPTVLIAGGSGISAAAYKHLAASYLIKGMNVMMVDYRGYGKSEGSPTSTKIKLDLETAYQYLNSEKHVQNKDLLVHGHCMGGGPASHLAARRAGVNLILDRSFADYREVARERFPIIRSILNKILPAIINFNNVKNIAKVKGNIAIVRGTEDVVISKEQTDKQVASLPSSRDKAHQLIVSERTSHTGSFDFSQLEEFLEKSNLRRSLF